MPNNLTNGEENRLLDLSWLTTDELALMATQGTDSSAGTEVAGGSYVRAVTSSLGSAAGGSKTTTASLDFDDMPATDIQGWAIFDDDTTTRKWYGYWAPTSATAVASTDLVHAVAHGLADDTKVVFQSGLTPAGLTANTTYYVVDSTTDDFSVATTLGGSAVDITADAASVVFGLVLTVASGDPFAVASGQLTLSLS